MPFHLSRRRAPYRISYEFKREGAKEDEGDHN